jgi:DNA polymerase-4
MTPFRTLYIDMNSFFASVEQQVDPSLRGRPLAITAVSADSGAVVAASYEAKAFGIGVGTRIYEARRKCPGIVFRPSRHRLYVRINQKIAALLDEMAELERIRSVDEFQVALGGRTATLEGATALAQQMKAAIRTRVGSQLRCSIGLGPNQLLAKIAGKLEKPDGLQWLAPENMPDRIAHLKLDDLPGISKGIRRRLHHAMIWNMRALYALDPRHARLIWRSVEGERFIRALQGENIPLIETERGGYGNSKVLAPEFRRPDKAQLVGRWLIEKATERLRRDGFCARRFALHARFLPHGGWAGSKTLMHSQDTRAFLGIYEALWHDLMQRHPRIIGSLSVHLGNVIPLSQRSGELFLPLAPARQSRDEKLAGVVDRINHRYKRRVITYGLQQDHPGFFEKG